MHHKPNQKGFAAVEALLIVIVVVLVGGTGYYVWHAKRAADKNLASSSSTPSKSSSSQDTAKLSSISGLELDASKLPANWSASSNSSTRVVLSAADKSCTVAAVLVTLTPQQAADASAYFKQQLGAQGGSMDYSKLPTTTLTVHTSAGNQAVTAYQLNLSIGGVTANQNIGFLAKGSAYVGLTQSCINTSNFNAANKALLAITVKG